MRSGVKNIGQGFLSGAVTRSGELTSGPTGGAGSTFDPDSVTGLRLWLDANDSSTLTIVSGDVSEWADKSSQESVASQTSAALRPERVEDAMNGLPVVRFAGGQVLSLNDLAISRNVSFLTIFAVGRYTGPTDVSANAYYLLSTTTATAGASRSGMLFRNATTTPSGPLIRIGSRRLDGDGATVATAAASAPGDGARVWTGELAYGDERSLVRQDGVGGTEREQWGAGATSDTDSAFVGIGSLWATADADREWTGDIAEILVYRTAARMSVETVEEIEEYLASKWGVTLA